MTNTKEIKLYLLNNAKHMGAMVTDDTEVWEKYNEKVLHLDKLESKAKVWDKLDEYIGRELNRLSEKESGFPYVDKPIRVAEGYFEHIREKMAYFKFESEEE